MRFVLSLCLTLVLAHGAVAQRQQAPESNAIEPKPVALKSGVATLAPTNTQIGFVGEHEGPKPDPRTGGFAKFVGKVEIKDDGSLEAVTLDIDTMSLFTEIPRLTGHLKSPDFFDVRQHPKATFKSTKIEKADQTGKVHVTGEFSLLGTTKEITIPTNVSVTSDGVTLVSDFTVDRTQFGMTFGQGRVKNQVAISVVVGAPTAAQGR